MSHQCFNKRAKVVYEQPVFEDLGFKTSSRMPKIISDYRQTSLQVFQLSLFLFFLGFQIRLVNSPDSHDVDHNSGHLQVFFNGTWCFLTDRNLRASKAHVACEQLGFRERALEYQIRIYTQPVAGKMVELDDFICRGDEKRLSDCSYNGWH